MTSKIKFLDNQDIWNAADNFRNVKIPADFKLPPIDVFYIAEVVLELDIIPLKDLFKDQHVDAALLPDLSGLYVDMESYMSWESGKKWIESRLRFSFAHELGHLVLHGREIGKIKFQSTRDFKIWAGSPSNFESPEYQADEFAGRFLVPRDILIRNYDEFVSKAEEENTNWREVEGTREYLAKKIAPRFGVNSKVIEVRLDREKIWPVE